MGDNDKTNLKKTSKAQITAKKIIGKYKKINHSKLKNFAELGKVKKDNVIFVKKVPLHSKNRMKRLIHLNDKVEFIKQVLVHPKNRMKKPQR